MPDAITLQEQDLVDKLQALTGDDDKKLFDFADSYNGVLEGKKDDELKDELQRRGMHSAFVFSTGGNISHIRQRGQPRRTLPEFVVLLAAVNLSGDASTRVGSPGSAGVNELIYRVHVALDGKPIAGGYPIFTKDFTMLVTTQELAMAAVTFTYDPPIPSKRP